MIKIVSHGKRSCNSRLSWTGFTVDRSHAHVPVRVYRVTHLQHTSHPVVDGDRTVVRKPGDPNHHREETPTTVHFEPHGLFVQLNSACPLPTRTSTVSDVGTITADYGSGWWLRFRRAFRRLLRRYDHRRLRIWLVATVYVCLRSAAASVRSPPTTDPVDGYGFCERVFLRHKAYSNPIKRLLK